MRGRAFFERLDGAIASISMIAAFAMMLLITIDVGGRYLFNRPLVGSQEIVEMLMIVTVFFGLSYTQKHYGHVGVDLVPGALAGTKIAWLPIVLNMATGIFVYVALSAFAFRHALSTYARGTSSIYLQWPIWWLGICVSLGCIFLVLRLVKTSWQDHRGIPPEQEQ